MAEEKIKKQKKGNNASFCLLSVGFPGGTVVKNPPANTGNTKDMSSIPGWRRPPGERNDNPLQFLPGEFQEQRSLAGNSPWSRKESNTTEQLCTSHSTALFIEYLVCAKYLIHTANQSIGLLLGRCKGSWVWQKVSPLLEIAETQGS